MENIPHIVNAAGLCICLEGSADVVIGSQSYRLRKGDMCSVLPRTILYAIRKSEDFKGYACVCTPQFLMSFNIPLGTPLYLFVRDNPCISLGEQECGWLLKMCRLLEEHAARKEHPCGMDISRLLASAVVYEVIGIYRKGNVIEQQPFSRKSKYYAEFVRLLTANYAQHRSVEFYADRLCITPRYLSAICKELTGMTATESINNHVMVNARILLASTDMSVLQISEELNFPNPSFFSQFFKRHEGVVPKTYRAMHRYEVGSDV
ncbi:MULTISPECIES: AraC family transcriptional regulator [Rikenellaceae]|jgi:AraC-like DNA-binding protein|nr:MULTISPECIES: AraC family transcriptional regulator [Rikenellaceae]MBP6423358.1 helix-turn-helix domain-containing protein [Tidjanibacter sp.]MBS1323601.1 helix-turn-helix transcriptional regulator [Rikenellaceae bacterium]MBP7005009.1 helix-turn-helix domain-containing protein [Tidjanibacter sp.]MBP8721455.1 helix-turn-helix domain-containing protein [Tidjanibacter sp.]MBP9546995.1 helix-turn-helix domain-containing protein [Tidjanibacter sp.]